MRNFHLQSLAQEVEHSLPEVLAHSLQDERVSLTKERSHQADVKLTRFTVTPTEPNCAGIRVVVEDGVDMLYLSIGEATPLEMELDEHSYTSLSGKEEFAEIIRAVKGTRNRGHL